MHYAKKKKKTINNNVGIIDSRFYIESFSFLKIVYAKAAYSEASSSIKYCESLLSKNYFKMNKYLIKFYYFSLRQKNLLFI